MSVKVRRTVAIAMVKLSLGGSISADSKRVNVRLKQVANGIINHAVPLHPTHARKCLGDYRDIKMALSFPGAFVSNVQLTLVLDQ
jgi:hypothetical protein